MYPVQSVHISIGDKMFQHRIFRLQPQIADQNSRPAVLDYQANSRMAINFTTGHFARHNVL